MTGEEIKQKLRETHRQFIELILSLSDDDFLFVPGGKWTAGQQMDHIYRSVAAVQQALLLPKWVIGLLIGKANRPSRDYDTLVIRYKLKLEGGGRAGGRFIPTAVKPGDKDRLKDKLVKAVNDLCNRIDHYDERQLDIYILPHPLLGKLTLREMLYFTIYHAEHHRQLVLRNLDRG